VPVGCVFVRNATGSTNGGYIIARGSNKTNEYRNVSLRLSSTARSANRAYVLPKCVIGD
jgi:hypothetical protein